MPSLFEENGFALSLTNCISVSRECGAAAVVVAARMVRHRCQDFPAAARIRVGMTARGRKAIEEFHRPLFEGDTSKGNPSSKNAVLKIDQVRIRFLRPDVASVDILWTQIGSVAPDGKDRGTRKGLASWVATKES